MNDSVDLWPHRLFWMGDPRAVAIFSVKVPRDEPGPWLGRGNWRPWRQRSTSTKGLDGWLRNNEPHLRQDAFATINRFYRWQRAQEYVVRLGAIFVDIDCGRSVFDYSAEDAADVLCGLVQVGRLAQPSMLQFSGRGLWAFWLLRDEQDPSTTPFANADNRELWTSLQQRTADRIATIFPKLKLDRTAGEFTRVTRLHGSVNPAADRRVRYVLLPGPAGEPIRYSLEELAGFYGLRRPAHLRPLGESEEDLMTEAELRGITEHALGWAQNGSKITNWKLAAFAGLDPVADRERIERLGLNLSTGPKGRNERTRERREMAQEILKVALDRGEDPPSVRKLAQVLTEQGCATGRSTAHALLGELWAELRPGNGPVLALG